MLSTRAKKGGINTGKTVRAQQIHFRVDQTPVSPKLIAFQSFFVADASLWQLKNVLCALTLGMPDRVLGALLGFGIVVQHYFSSSFVIPRYFPETNLVSNKSGSGGEDAESILSASTEIDRGSFLKILCWARDFADAIAEHYSLSKHLVIEDEVVGVFEQGEALENISRKRAKAGVIFGQLDA